MAMRVAAEGGRFGKGGFTWVFLQAWLLANSVLLVLIVLTLFGVLH
jgi:hypothetical protein